ncbi:MAG: tetratricopeptide repeat protein [Promethearchaeota archaeon]
MKLTNLKIADLITPDAKLTFLVGAGCSVDSPSNLPAGKTMMEALIRYTCAESEIDKLLGNAELEEGGRLEGLRFEQLVEIIRDRLDPELKIIDFYGLCDKPNIQHFFLAEMMKQGQFVLTTNFDFLIEHALQDLVPKEEMKIVITKEDFEHFSNPQELFSNGIKTLYKIHGSTKNTITEESTRDSLIATIQAFGANKEGDNVFQLESFKQPAFVNITKNRSLVVMGYSGSDDFDIVPTLKVLKDIHDIIWINYIHDDGGKELIYEINREDMSNHSNFSKVDQILVDIKQMNYAKQILRVDVNTSRMVRELISAQIKDDSDTFSINLYEWLSDNIQSPDKFRRLYIPYKIYSEFDIYEDAMCTLNQILNIAEHDENHVWKSFALNEMGSIYMAQGNYPEALKRYKEALQIEEQLGNLKEKATRLNNIGDIYYAQGNYPEASKKFEEALQIAEQLEDLSGKATCLSNIGSIYNAQGKYPEALKRYEEALQIFEELGDLVSRSTLLNNIGAIHLAQGNYPEAMNCYEEALQIAEQLGDLSGKAACLSNLGGIYKLQGNYPEALKRYEEALQIDEQLGDLSGKATDLNDIGMIYDAQGNYPEALKNYKEALQIAEQLGDLSGKATCLSNIGSIFNAQGKYQEALKRYEKALQLTEQLGNIQHIAACSLWIGIIYNNLNDTSKALKNLEYALENFEKLELKNEAEQIREVISKLRKN